MWQLLIITPLLAAVVNLDQMMTPDDQQKTGVANLRFDQKKALETWMGQHFVPCSPSAQATKPRLSIALNINGGKKLLLSDHSLYEVAPNDVAAASAWLSPVEIDIVPSNDPIYPDMLVNRATGVSVKAKRINPSS